MKGVRQRARGRKGRFGLGGNGNGSGGGKGDEEAGLERAGRDRSLRCRRRIGKRVELVV